MNAAITLEIPVRWGDLDALGHVNNTVFFRWFEDVRIETFVRVGLDTDGPNGLGPILATTTCDFLAPVHFPATVTVSCTIGRIGNTSFVMDYGASVSGALVARGSAVVVLVDYQTGDKASVPDPVRAGLAEFSTPGG